MPAIDCTIRCTVQNTSTAGRLKAIDNGWELLGDAAELKTFFYGDGIKLFHQGLKEHAHKHVCAAHSTWAFDAQDGSPVCSVVFLRYEFRGGLKKEMGGSQPSDEKIIWLAENEGTLHTLIGPEVYKDWKKNNFFRRPAHVWKRAQHGEIACDFCVG